MTLAYIAIGSNLGDSKSTASTALAELRGHESISDFQLSPWYRSKAIGGPSNQPDYLNAVCAIKTELTALDLLHLLQALENKFGRTRDVRWGPRTLDLDIIWMDSITSQTETLTLPHPRAHQRAFVLKPLIDLNAQFLLAGKPLAIWVEQVQDQIIHPVSP